MGQRGEPRELRVRLRRNRCGCWLLHYCFCFHADGSPSTCSMFQRHDVDWHTDATRVLSRKYAQRSDGFLSTEGAYPGRPAPQYLLLSLLRRQSLLILQLPLHGTTFAFSSCSVFTCVVGLFVPACVILDWPIISVQIMLRGNRTFVGNGHVRNVYLVEYEGRRVVVKTLRTTDDLKEQRASLKRHKWEMLTLDSVSK